MVNISKKKIVGLGLGLSMLASPAFAGESRVDMNFTDINWVHYDTQKVGLTGSTIIDGFGKIEVGVGKENGDARIFSELNIGAFNGVSGNPWLPYSADFFSLKYGTEYEFDSGLKLTGGVGAGTYRGENDDIGKAGSKKITLNSFGAKSKLEFGSFGVYLDYTNNFFNPEQFHLFSFLPIPLKQDTRIQEHFTDLDVQTPYLDFQTNWVNGGKSDEYSMLIAKNDMSFSGGVIGIFPKFAFGGGHVSLGPRFLVGSQEGSLNELDYSSAFGGVGARFVGGEYEVGLSYLDSASDSSKLHPQFSLRELKDSQKLEFFLQKYKSSDRQEENLDYRIFTSYSNEDRQGDFSFSDMKLAYITGGVNQVNDMNTETFSFAAEKHFDNSWYARANVDLIDTSGDFYGSENSLDESGSKVGFVIGKKF